MLFDGKNILVTGSTGLIGYNLVCRLLNEGAGKIYATGRSINKLNSTFENYRNRKELFLIEHDATKLLPDTIRDLDYIFHAAGPMEREIVKNCPVDVILPNIIGTINCMEFLKGQKKLTGRRGRLVVFSSVTVYSNPTEEDYVAVEEATSYAQSLDAVTACYSESKRMSEVIAKSYAKQYGIDTVIARFSTVYGPTKNIPDTAFYEFIRKSQKGEDIIVNSNAAPRRDNIFVVDAINGLITIALKGKSAESYNLSSNGDLDNYAAVDEIAQIAAQKAGKGSRVFYREQINSTKAGLKLDNKKLKSLDWKVCCCLERGVLKTINSLYKKKAKE